MLTCPECSHANPRGTKFCEACGASVESVAEREREADEIEAAFLLEQVKKARTALLVVAVLQVIGTVAFAALQQVDGAATATMASIAVVFFGLAWWCKKNPFAASIVGLVVFVTVHLADAIVDPSAIVRGIIVKVIVIVVLVRAIGAGLKYRAFRRERGLA